MQQDTISSFQNPLSRASPREAFSSVTDAITTCLSSCACQRSPAAFIMALTRAMLLVTVCSAALFAVEGQHISRRPVPFTGAEFHLRQHPVHPAAGRSLLSQAPSTSTIVAQASSSASVVELIHQSPNGVHDVLPKLVDVSAQASASATANVILGAASVDVYATASSVASIFSQQSSKAPQVHACARSKASVITFADLS